MKNLKLLREELTIGGLALIAFLLIRYALSLAWPDTPLFDLASEMETILLAPVKLIMLFMFTYFVMRITWPQAYNYLRESIYFNWHAQGLLFKRQFSIGVAVAIFFALIMLTSCSVRAGEIETRQNLVEYLHSQLDVREATGKNDGPAVKKYLNHVGLGEGYAWCVAFVSYNLDYFGIPNPKSAWSPHYAKRKDVVWSSKMKINGKGSPGDVFTIYSVNRKRVVHGGFMINYSKSGDYIITIEGNTNVEGSREGIGVFKRKRSLRKIYAISNYITPYYETVNSSTGIIDGIIHKLPKKTNSGIHKSNGQYLYRGNSYTQRYDCDYSTGQYLFKYSIVNRFIGSNIHTEDIHQKQSSPINSFSQQWSSTCSGQLRQFGGGINAPGFNYYNTPKSERVQSKSNHDKRKEYSLVGKRLISDRSIIFVEVNYTPYSNTEVNNQNLVRIPVRITAENKINT